MPAIRHIAGRILKARHVYAVSYYCDTPGPDFESGTIEAYWTGDVDTWGKLTFRPVDGSPYRYLFPREIIELSEE